MLKDRLITILLTATVVLSLQAVIASTPPPALANRLERIEALLSQQPTADDASVVRAIETLGRDYLRDMESSLDKIEGSSG